ncbi:putative G-protein coupled receptor B0563.6 [Oratosquilla oratoria]|uniref:putative G-protein coupled receptor B0563.6 n=1 Tax=Oratosquilla oratoria TaxID=337810 RepID=UPI003F760A32
MYLEYASKLVGPYPAGDFDGNGIVNDNDLRILLGAGNITEESLAVQRTHHIAYAIIAPIIISIGMMGNIFVIVVLCHPYFRGVTYRYFITLAICDLLGLFFSISAFVHLLHPVTSMYSTAVWYSYLEILFVNAPLSISNLIVVCVTVDRFFSVCRPRDFKTVHSWRLAKRGIFGAILLSCVIWIPTCFLKTPEKLQNCESVVIYGAHAYENATGWVSCMAIDPLEEKWYLVYSWLRQILVTFLPIIILIVLNIMIIRAFINITKKRQKLQGNSLDGRTKFNLRPDSVHNEDKMKEDRELLILLCAITISFFITMVPAGIFNAMYTEFLSTELEYEIFRAVANNLEILNHAMNFYIYVLCSKPIRRAITNYCMHRKFSLSASNISNNNNNRPEYNGAKKRVSSDTRGRSFSPDGYEKTQDNILPAGNRETAIIILPSELEEISPAHNYSPTAGGNQPFYDNPLYTSENPQYTTCTGRAEDSDNTNKIFTIDQSSRVPIGDLSVHNEVG